MEKTISTQKEAKDFIVSAVYDAERVMDAAKVEAYVDHIYEPLPASVKEKGEFGGDKWLTVANMWEEYHKTHSTSEFFAGNKGTGAGNGNSVLNTQGQQGGKMTRRNTKGDKKEFKPSEISDAAKDVLESLVNNQAMEEKARMSAVCKPEKVVFMRPSAASLHEQGLLPDTVKLNPEMAKKYKENYSSKVIEEDKAKFEQFLADCQNSVEVKARYTDSVGAPIGLVLNQPGTQGKTSNIQAKLYNKDNLQDFLLLSCALTTAPNDLGVYAYAEVVTYEEQTDNASEPVQKAKIVTKIKNAAKVAKDPAGKDSFFFAKEVDKTKDKEVGRISIDEKYTFRIAEPKLNPETNQEEMKVRKVNPTVSYVGVPVFKLAKHDQYDMETEFGALKPKETTVPTTEAERKAVGEKLKKIYTGVYGGDFENQGLAERLSKVLDPARKAEQDSVAAGNPDSKNTMKG